MKETILSASIDYTGKKVFIGIDVHKRTYSIVTIVEGAIVKKWQTLASPNKLVQQLQKYFAGAQIFTAYEASFSGFVLHRTPDGVTSLLKSSR